MILSILVCEYAVILQKISLGNIYIAFRLKYPVWFDHNQWVFLIRSNCPHQILKHLYLNITCQEHALFLNIDRPTGRHVIGMYDYIFLIHVSCCFCLSIRRVDCSNNVGIIFCLKIISKKCFIPHRNLHKCWSLGVKKACQNCYWMAFIVRKKEPLLSLKCCLLIYMQYI